MEPMRCLIIEDETPSVELLKDYIARLPEVLSFAAHCDNAREARRILKTEKMDVIFLDMELSGNMTGLDFLEFMDTDQMPPVIVTSGKSDFILESLEFRPRGIMQKGTRSFAFENFERIIRDILREKSLEINQTAAKIPTNSPELTYIILRIDGISQRIDLNQIKYVCADSGMSVYHLKEGTPLRVWDSLKKITNEILPPHYFARIHDKYIINKLFFQKAEWRDRQLWLTDGKSLPIGDTYLRDVKQFIEDV